MQGAERRYCRGERNRSNYRVRLRKTVLRVEERDFLLELLGVDDGLHCVSGVVDFSVLDQLEEVVDQAFHGGNALGVSNEGTSL